MADFVMETTPSDKWTELMGRDIMVQYIKDGTGSTADMSTTAVASLKV